MRTPVVLVYSHREDVRERIVNAVGRRPAPDVGRIEFLECASVADVLMAIDDRAVDLVILDGEGNVLHRHAGPLIREDYTNRFRPELDKALAAER